MTSNIHYSLWLRICGKNNINNIFKKQEYCVCLCIICSGQCFEITKKLYAICCSDSKILCQLYALLRCSVLLHFWPFFYYPFFPNKTAGHERTCACFSLLYSIRTSIYYMLNEMQHDKWALVI